MLKVQMQYPIVDFVVSMAVLYRIWQYGFNFYVFYYSWWGGTKSLGTAATSALLYKPQMIDEDDCRAIGGMKIGRGNRSTWRKPAPAPLCPPQIPHDQTRARTRAAAVESQRLTAWAMARPKPMVPICQTSHSRRNSKIRVVYMVHTNYVKFWVCQTVKEYEKANLNKTNVISFNLVRQFQCF
jgi:hypothetical protein